MSLFGFVTGKRKSESIALIDIGTDSIGGAYMHLRENELPVMVFMRRIMVEFREDEPRDKAMLRALKTVSDILIKEGAPVLSRATGSGSVHQVLVSIDAPWQKTTIRREYFEQDKPFTFTKSFAAAALQKVKSELPDKMRIEESIIGTILNGYETQSPYNEEAHRAEIIVLASLIDETVAREVEEALQEVFQTRHIELIAGSSLRFQALQIVFPHERNALIFDAAYSLTTIALIRHDLLVSILEAESTVTAEAQWVKTVSEKLIELSKYYPLPRTIFLIVRETMTGALQKSLQDANLGKLWLTDTPPRIIGVVSSHLASAIKQSNASPPDVTLLLMGLYIQHHAKDE